jgi:hypothetical protein
VARFLPPTPAFENVKLDIVRIGTGALFGRILLGKYPDPLGFGKSRSRFSDPRRRVDRNRFGVLYLGRTLKVCFVEAVLRDARNGAIGDFPFEEIEFRQRTYARIGVGAPLRLVDLRDDGRIRMGIPSDVTGAADQRAGRAWSLAIHDHPHQPDGLVYPSRLNNGTNLAIYDRAIAKLAPIRSYELLTAPGFADVLEELRVAIL